MLELGLGWSVTKLDVARKRPFLGSSKSYKERDIHSLVSPPASIPSSSSKLTCIELITNEAGLCFMSSASVQFQISSLFI